MKYRLLINGICQGEYSEEEYAGLSDWEQNQCIVIHEDALPNPYAEDTEETTESEAV